jgi:hypothetical protein
VTAALVLAAGAALLASDPAPAAPAAPGAPTAQQISEATERFARATEMFAEENLAGALAEFRRAYSVAPHHRVLYNIGQVCFLLRDYPCALESLSRYLAEGGAEVPADRQSEVKRDLQRLEGRVARLRILVDQPDAEVAVDDVVVGRSPLADPVVVTAGRPRITATLPGRAAASKVIELAAQETTTVQLSLAPTTPRAAAMMTAPPPVDPPVGDDARRASLTGTRLTRRPTLPWVITGALAVAAGTFGGLALWSSADLEARRNRFGIRQPSELADRSARTKHLALAADILIGSALVAAGISTYLTLFPGVTQVALVHRF